VRRHIGGSVIALALPLAPAAHSAPQTPVFRIDHVTDGDTVVLRNGQRARLVQIDTPEVFFGRECYRRAASRVTERLLPPGARVRLYAEPATHRIDDYGRLLRYVVRVKDGVNVNLALVAVGAAAPYFYERRRGEYASRLEILAKSARRKHLGCGVHVRERRTTLTGESTRAASSACPPPARAPRSAGSSRARVAQPSAIVLCSRQVRAFP
jgi:endonuclease YncB( thermonuclease family)